MNSQWSGSWLTVRWTHFRSRLTERLSSCLCWRLAVDALDFRNSAVVVITYYSPHFFREAWWWDHESHEACEAASSFFFRLWKCAERELANKIKFDDNLRPVNLGMLAPSCLRAKKLKAMAYFCFPLPNLFSLRPSIFSSFSSLDSNPGSESRLFVPPSACSGERRDDTFFFCAHSHGFCLEDHWPFRVKTLHELFVGLERRSCTPRTDHRFPLYDVPW